MSGRTEARPAARRRIQSNRCTEITAASQDQPRGFTLAEEGYSRMNRTVTARTRPSCVLTDAK
ncbi:hypothetical protein KL86PLE_30148 [uncultured Pleomorphomonas sp.]|uniref:Uncharacterized protein n=1 Tax=uncultured Pleomorphomonas sp. TaxID=442121 RepID=A0A212LDT3_9HYPH|nr:hypothetical protein KL86PLE_30148 [uncultured Pleomorphomonas sp.]